MNAAAADPRWGNVQRDKKALAIWLTLRQIAGERIGEGRWADIGCGSGGIAAGLAGKVAAITGIDPEPWQAWTALAAEHPNLSFHSGACDGSEPPLPAGSLDVVVCNQVYEHVSDPQQLLRNIHAMLRPGGCCYFAGPNWVWPVEPHVFWPFVHWLPRRLAQRLMRGLGSRQADALDAYAQDWWTLQRWFRETGFSARNAIGARIAAELSRRGRDRAAQWIRGVPDGLIDLATPLAPGFVFVLTRRD